MLVPVSRPAPAAVVVSLVADRIMHGAVLHDPAGCYTVGHAQHPGWYALYAWTDRADHSREKVWTDAEPCPEGRYTLAARAFVDAIGEGPALAAVRRYDERTGSTSNNV